MCGRFDLTANAEQIIEYFALQRAPKYERSYNIAPGRKILTIVEREDGSRKGTNLHWGLVPSWAKDVKIGWKLINARMETVREKPSFRAAFARRRKATKAGWTKPPTRTPLSPYWLMKHTAV
ncbi:SOS response-associated peptidase [Methylomonas sp. MgM2]